MQSRNINMSDLRKKYIKEVVPKMKEKFGYKNTLAVPKITKTVVNIGIGGLIKDEKARELIIKDLALITGQKPVATQVKKAIAGFKTRQGMIIGLKTTLRGKRMFEFLSRLINVAIPRIRDFRGLNPKSIDQGGNLTIGIKEHIIFPEISQEDIKRIFGFEVSVITNAKTRKEALELFKLLGFPIKKDGQKI
jgi:large subunit ribosomal protein L5